MVSVQSLLFLSYVISGLLPLTLIWPASRNRDNAGTAGMVILVVGVSLWGLASAAHTVMTSQQLAFATWNVLLLGASLSIVGWFLVLSVYADLLTPSRRVIAILALEPILLQLFAWTNPSHYLLYGPATSFTSVTSIVANYQVVFWVHAAVGYILNAFTALLVLLNMLKARGVRRTQGLALCASVVPPAVTNVFHLVVETPFDLTPFGFAATVFILGWAIFRAQFLDIIPIGRERAVENMSDAVVMLDADGRVIDSNPAAREMVGVDEDDIGMSGEQFFAPFSETAERFRDVDNVDTEISIARNGQMRYFDLTISPIRDLAGEQEGRLVVLRDITLLKEREQQLRENEQELDLLRQVLSRVLRHNIRNDLTVVKGYNELFASEFGDERQAMAETVISKADDLVEISEKARTVEKLMQRDQQPTTLDLSELTAELCEACQSKYPTVSFTLDCPDDCRVTVTPSLELALKNVIENAAKHDDTATPRVDVTLTDDGDEVHIAISDGGPGIPEQELQVLERGEETPLEHGSGIGLWIVDWVVRNSDVSVRFDVDDDGTTAIFTLPA